MFELDSNTMVKFVNDGYAKTHPCSELIQAINNLRSYQWNVIISHCFREANRVVDFVANTAHNNAFLIDSMVIFGDLLEMCATCFMEDIRGVYLSKIVAL